MKKTIALLLISFLLTGCSNSASTSTFDGDASTKPIQNETSAKEPQKTPEEIKSEIITEKIDSMTLEEKTGQLFMCEFRQDNNGNIITVTDDMKNNIAKYNLGGVILFGENIQSKNQVTKFNEDLKNSSDSPIFICIDEEGGIVSRLKNCSDLENYDIPTAETLAAAGTEEVYKNNSIIGKNLNMLGFNVDFAPVADINTNPENPVIGSRAYGSDPVVAGECVASAVKGIQDNNIYAALKHFPGHGDTQTDSHNGEAIVNHTMERLLSTETIPFQKGIEAGAEFVMVAHIKTPNATTDNMPASLSSEIINGILRDKMDFNGIVITDALNMGAISQFYSSEDVALSFIKSGGDILLMPVDIDSSFNAIVSAVNSGEITEERINQSLNRILSVKYDIAMNTGYGKDWFGIK